MRDEQVTKETIMKYLTKLGISRGDKIILHSNLRKLAKPRNLVKLSKCGADCLIEAFLDQVGSEGILCVPTFTYAFVSNSAGPAGQVFDPDTTPSRVGSITNAVLERPERVRSLHPTHPWAAIGKDAAEFVEGHEKVSTFGRDSICGRMYDLDSKIVWFGTTGTSNTTTHFAEDWLDMPYMTTEEALVKDGDRDKTVTVYRSPSGPRDFYNDGCKLDKLLDTWNIKTIGKIHRATVTVMRHREFMNRLLRAMIDDPCLLLKDDKDNAYHTQFHDLNREHIEKLKKDHGGTHGIMSHLRCN